MKKIISVFLCAVMIFALAAPSYAANESENVPFVLVTGMNVLPLYKDGGTEASQKIWPMTGSSVASLAAKLVLPLTRLALTKDYAAFNKSVLPALCDTFDYMRCDENGASVYNVSTPLFPESMAQYPELYAGEEKDEQGILNAACQKYGAENVYFLNYDWRLDPLEHADSLNDMIEYVKKDRGCDKVNLACCSMGGTVTMSYLYKYGSASVKNLLILSTAFQGVTAVGDMFGGELYVDKDSALRRVINLGKGDLKEFIFEALTYAIDKAGLADWVCDLANGLIEGMGDELYNGFLKEVFGTMPGIWDLVAAEDYENAKAYMLDSEKNALLIKRTDEYIYSVQIKAKDILDGAKQGGSNVYIVCQYNMQALPVSHNSALNNDLLIDTKFASGGAICADLGKTLGDGYVQAIDDSHNHLSPDGVIDASTCMYPENTWFIKDQAHVDYNVGETTDFIFTLADSEKQLTVFDNENYTQFMKYDYDENTLTAMTSSYVENPSAFETLVSVINYICPIIKSAIIKILDFIISEVL